MNPVRYLFSTPEGIIVAPAALLNRPLVEPCKGAHHAITLKDYFCLLADFFKEKRTILLSNHNRNGDQHHAKNFNDLDIISEKTGSFYQIARCVLKGEKGQIQFCAATSISQRKLLYRDFKNLRLLYHEKGLDFLPRPYLTEELTIGKKGERLRIAVSEWLDGYWEWHLKTKEEAELWIPGKGTVRTGKKRCLELFYAICLELALSFDPVDCRHVWLWSNCSGDFVVNGPENTKTETKLTTVRYYGNPWQFALLKGPRERMFFTLFYFFLDTCLTIRIDRRSGTGKYIFAGRNPLKHAVSGFLAGLKVLFRKNKIRTQDLEQFIDLLKGWDETALSSIYHDIIRAHKRLLRADVSVMGKHLKEHIHQLVDILYKCELPVSEPDGALVRASLPFL